MSTHTCHLPSSWQLSELWVLNCFPAQNAKFLSQSWKQHGQVYRATRHDPGTNFCSSLFSVAMTNSMTEINLGRKAFLLAHLSYSPSWGRSGQGPGGRNWSRGHGGVLPTRLPLLTSSVCFLIPPAQGWHYSQWAGPSHIDNQKMPLQNCLLTNLMIAFSQFKKRKSTPRNSNKHLPLIIIVSLNI